jgi:hypothetical protein
LDCCALQYGDQIISSTKTKGRSKVHKVMKEFKEGSFRSGRSGKKVSSRKQAEAIALSEARRSGAKIPKKSAS